MTGCGAATLIPDWLCFPTVSTLHPNWSAAPGSVTSGECRCDGQRDSNPADSPDFVRTAPRSGRMDGYTVSKYPQPDGAGK